MRYADVAVTCGTGRHAGAFSYSVPAALALNVGQVVWVPFGRRIVQGVVLKLADEAPAIPTKDVLSAQEGPPALTPAQVALAQWLSRQYLCSLAAAVTQLLPAELRQTGSALYSLSEQSPEHTLPPRAAALVAALAARPREGKDLARIVPGREGARELRRLVEQGVVSQSWVLQRSKVRPKLERTICLTLDDSTLPATLATLAHAPKQEATLRWLADKAPSGTILPLAEVRAATGIGTATLGSLARCGYVEVGEREVQRSPLACLDVKSYPLPALTARQREALAPIVTALGRAEHTVFLLHGVTGSGKGEVYLHALTEAVRLGRQAIVLVPEIALTPQTIQRFSGHFPGRVAVLHSRLSPGEHYDEWRRIRDGQADIVIGSRSAIFAPARRLGLVVVDEEHEWSYKQTEKDPRYHARDVAIQLGKLVGAVVLLGSATPDVATYYQAHDRKVYKLLQLAERVQGGYRSASTATAEEEGSRPGALGERNVRVAPAPPPTIPMPKVQIVDLRREPRAGVNRIFSRPLLRGMAEVLAQGGQTILFLNRRGTATFVICRECGYVARCPRCDVPLVYHSDSNQLVCHHCNRAFPPPGTCPVCWSSRIKLLGLGTQRVEAEVQRLFPKARVVRWDRDTTKGKSAHQRILEQFQRHEADVLVGTQMVAKGLDLPQVSLVGVILADSALQLPDFRAAERTFQLLTQVSGRAGRGLRPGKVVIQTFNPGHYCVRAASQHSYAAFYDHELPFRSTHRYPPFVDLARLVYGHSNEARCRTEAERLATFLRQEIERRGLPNLEVIGPAPAFRSRLRGHFRWHLLVRGGELHVLLAGLLLPPGWILDVDPISLL
ncbi:MAG: primosomal protein N' [Dehalococcoidales bacterium]|nr:primosomal protein N' [Dehalococcoidales bacterium]